MDKYKFKYSLIIPHHETPDLLCRCLESVPYRDDLQIIVVDDNSKDNDKYLEKYPILGRRNVLYVPTKEGRGAGYARNVGLRFAEGKWLMFADSDDYYDEKAFEIIDGNLSDDLDILYFNVTYKGKFNIVVLKINEKYSSYLKSGNSIDVRFCCWTPWNKVISHKLVVENNLLFDEIPSGNDAMFALNASKHAKTYKIIQDKLYYYQSDNPNSITFKKRSFEKKMAALRIHIKISNFMIENGYWWLSPNILERKTLYSLFIDDGFKKVIDYFSYLHRNYGILKAFGVSFIYYMRQIRFYIGLLISRPCVV